MANKTSTKWCTHQRPGKFLQLPNLKVWPTPPPYQKQTPNLRSFESSIVKGYFPVLGELETLQPKDANPGAFNSRVKTSILHFSQPLTSANLLAKNSTTFLFAKVLWKQMETYQDRYLKLKHVSKSGISSISYCWWCKHLANRFSIPAAFFPSTVASNIASPPARLVYHGYWSQTSFCNTEVQSNVKALAILGGGGATPKIYTRL